MAESLLERYVKETLQPERDILFLRLCAEKIRNGQFETWEIPSVRADTLSDIAERYCQRRLPECVKCREIGLLPSRAVACTLHSLAAIDELKAEIEVLRNKAGTSEKLHLAIAEHFGTVPSEDGLAELEMIKDQEKRADRLRRSIEAALEAFY